MKKADFLHNEIGEDERAGFALCCLLENLHRGKRLAAWVVGFEVILLLANLITSYLKVDNRFAFDAYLILYVLMILLNLWFLFSTKGVNLELLLHSPKRVSHLEATLLCYIALMMSWGSVVSLMDQRLYGQLIAYMVNLIACSVIYLVDKRRMLLPYAIATLILVIGLPFFQEQQDILIGHYINLMVFIVLSWVASRIIYGHYWESYRSKRELDRANGLLEIEVAEREEINKKLRRANKRLQEMALLDALTAIPNRRSLQEFVDREFPASSPEGTSLTVIMIDIDHFKQYNDHYGHERGDYALIAVANQVHSVVEDSCEMVGRWGGEEFLYLGFHKSQQQAAEIAEAMRQKVLSLKLQHEYAPTHPYVTVSLGACTLHIREKRQIQDAIKLADQALYLAKSRGRNCVVSLDAQGANPGSPCHSPDNCMEHAHAYIDMT